MGSLPMSVALGPFLFLLRWKTSNCPYYPSLALLGSFWLTVKMVGFLFYVFSPNLALLGARVMLSCPPRSPVRGQNLSEKTNPAPIIPILENGAGCSFVGETFRKIEPDEAQRASTRERYAPDSAKPEIKIRFGEENLALSGIFEEPRTAEIRSEGRQIRTSESGIPVVGQFDFFPSSRAISSEISQA